jgi:hypothetical protein
LRDAIIFGLSAFLVALPWYLKNFLWTGNPVFPLYFPQSIIDPAEFKLWTEYINSFGTGKYWYDYLLLPVNIYLQHEKFGTFMGSMEMPTPLFLFVLAYPWFRTSMQLTTKKILDVLVSVTVIQFIIWALGSQQNRFLLPLFPGLSILASAVLLSLAKKFNKHHIGSIIKVGLISGMVVVTLIFMGIYTELVRPDRVLLGIDSKQNYLVRVLRDYSGITYINKFLPQTAVSLFLWDGRGYYCKDKCVPDVDQSKWSALIQDTTNLTEISDWLKERNITHILFSKEDITFFLLRHDPQKINLNATKYLLEEFVPKCTEEVYTDEWVQIFEIKQGNQICINGN